MKTSNQLSIHWHIKGITWSVLILEGSALMATELISAKLLAPYYGSSLYLWTSMLCCTLMGLALGYLIGGEISKSATPFKLVLITLLASLSVILMPEICKTIAPKTFNLSLKTGTLTSCFLLITPTILLLGAIGPIAVQLLSSDDASPPGTIAGKAFFTSTISGVISTFIFAFFLIPEKGLEFSTKATAASLCTIGIPYLLLQILKHKDEAYRT